MSCSHKRCQIKYAHCNLVNCRFLSAWLITTTLIRLDQHIAETIEESFFLPPPPSYLVANLGLLDSSGQPLLDAIEEDGQLLQRPAEVLGDVRLEGVAVLLLHVLAEAVQRGYLHPEQTFGILRIISRIQNNDKKIVSKS